MLEIALAHVNSNQNRTFMNNDTIKQFVLFSGVTDKPVNVAFDQPDGSSDGGALLLKAYDSHLGLSEALADCLIDIRQASKVAHSLRDLVRLFGLACGYEDCNDAVRLSSDPMHRFLLDRDPVEGRQIASQPTLSRFENAVGSRELVRMNYALANAVVKRHSKRLKNQTCVITLDMDPTDDACHGQQQLSFFERHYDNYCLMPVACFVQFDN